MKKTEVVIREAIVSVSRRKSTSAVESMVELEGDKEKAKFVSAKTT